jgi:hypothetical protein
MRDFRLPPWCKLPHETTAKWLTIQAVHATYKPYLYWERWVKNIGKKLSAVSFHVLRNALKPAVRVTGILAQHRPRCSRIYVTTQWRSSYPAIIHRILNDLRNVLQMSLCITGCDRGFRHGGPSVQFVQPSHWSYSNYWMPTPSEWRNILIRNIFRHEP